MEGRRRAGGGKREKSLSGGTVDLSSHLRIQAHGNRLANRRLHAAMAPLSQADLHAPRTSFFPSLAETLNHILGVDEYYVGALCGDADLVGHWERFAPHAALPAIAAAQARIDQRLIAFCAGLDAAGCERVVEMPRLQGRIQRDRAANVLAHLHQHQTHHRGQVHAMLVGTPVKPPQLDEFLLPSEPHYRVDDMAALGWSEAAVYGADGSQR